MARLSDLIRTITFRSTTEGVAETTGQMNALAASGKAVTDTFVQTEKATLSAERAHAKLSAQLQQSVKDQDNYARAVKTIETAHAQGIISMERAVGQLGLAAVKYNQAGQATQAYGNSTKLARHELVNFSRQVQDVGVSLASGQSAFTVLIQQGSQIADIFISSGVSVGQFAKQLAGMIGPIGLLAGGVGLVVAAFGALSAIWSSSALQLDNLSKLTGVATGQLQDMRDAAAAKGVGFEEWEKSMKGFAAASNTAQRGIGNLAELFRLNGVIIDKDMNVNLQKVADLVKNATSEQDKMNVLQAAGLSNTQEMVRLYEQGGEALRQQQDALENANIDQGMIDVARQFNEAWDKAWAAFKSAAFAVIGEVLRALKGLVDAATPFIKKMLDAAGGLVKGVLGSARTRADELAEGGAPEDQGGGGGPLRLTVRPARPTVMPEDLAAMERELTLLQSRKRILGDNADAALKVAIAQKELDIQKAKGVEFSDKEAQAYKDAATAAGAHGTKMKELKVDYSAITSAVTSFASTFVNSMLSGVTATESLGKALEALGKQMTQVGLNTFAKEIAKSIDSLLPSLTGLFGGIGGGLATAGIGIGISLIGKLFGSGDDAEAKKQQQAQQKAADELVKAKEAWAGMSGEVEAFNRAAAGFELGALTESIQGLFEQAAPLLRAARAAQDAIGSAEISATLAAGLNRLLNEFATDLPFLIAEFGKTGPIAEAKDVVKTLMDSFRDLNSSILEFATRTLSDQTDAFVQLNTAARAAVLSLLDVSPPLSEIVTKVNELTAKASPMVDALVELGFAAEDAAIAVQDKLIAALALLREGFLDELQKQINELSGGAWINQADELMDKVAQMRSDAAALGASTELIDRFYVLSAQKIIDENQLAGESFDQLVIQLGLGEAGLKQFEEAVEDATDTIVRSVEEIASAIQSNEDRLFNALHRSDSLADQLARFDLKAQREREAEVKAGGEAIASLERALAQERLNIIIDYNAKVLAEQQAAAKAAADEAKRAADEALAAAERAAEEQRQALEEATNFLTGALQNIAAWIQHFLAGADSPLPPSQQLASAQASFANQKALAIGGNRDALQNITQNAQDVVDAARRYYGSSAAGQGIVANIISQLQGLPAQVSAEQFIVDGLTEPIDNVADTVEDATAAQTAALVAQLNALQLAIQSGDASAVAAALLPLFDRLDSNLNGLLDFDEFRAGLSGMASDFALRDMFTRLDTDNSGSLSKLELMAQASQNLGPINQNTDEIAFNTFQALSLQYDQGVLVNTSAIAQGVNQSNAVLSTISGTLSSILSFQQPQLTVASQSDNRLTNINGFIGTIASWSAGSNHAMGGYITGGVSGRDSVHGMLTPGEFVVREPIARNNSWLADFNSTGQMPHMRTPYASNDNGPVIFALGKMERALLLGIKALIETQLQSAGIIARPIEEANKLQRTRRGEKKVA